MVLNIFDAFSDGMHRMDTAMGCLGVLDGVCGGIGFFTAFTERVISCHLAYFVDNCVTIAAGQDKNSNKI